MCSFLNVCFIPFVRDRKVNSIYPFFTSCAYVEHIRMQWHVLRACIVNDCEAGYSGTRVLGSGHIQDKTYTKGTTRNFSPYSLQTAIDDYLVALVGRLLY